MANERWGFVERPHELFLSSTTDPWPTEALARSALRQNYPCRRLRKPHTDRADVTGPCCDQPSAYHARGNAARYGHVCLSCWQGFDEAERVLYAYVGLRAQPGLSPRELFEEFSPLRDLAEKLSKVRP